MDVTQEILAKHLIYGASDNTAPHTLSSSKSLNYANGATLLKPVVERITKIPYTFNFKDSVGLFGTENTFVRVDLDIQDTGLEEVQIDGYDDASITNDGGLEINDYESGLFDFNQDNEVVNQFDPCIVTFRPPLPSFFKPKISIDLTNLKTGNQYVDAWFDVRLYTKNKEEHPYDKLYLNLKDSFYIGFHARNTRRLPYNVRCVIGDEYLGIGTIPNKQFLPANLQ
jgi:hypothetical protein